MPVFISHSHQDKDFVDKLAGQLVRHKAWVWLDRWELRAGDSLIDKIQSAIKTASALIVVLSKASLASNWCQKELNAGLIRELEERHVVVLPLLLENCDIPMFLREKKYADFRTNFDDGLQETLRAIASVTSDTQGRIENPKFHTDWGIAWGYHEGLYIMHLRFIDHGVEIPYCVLTEALITCNEELTKKIRSYEEHGTDWFGRLMIVGSLYGVVKQEKNPIFVLEESFEQTKTLHFIDERKGFAHTARISSVRLGTETGMNTVIDWGSHIIHLFEDLSSNVTHADREKLRAVMGKAD